ncbi:MAG: porphobilinogen synthase, partial [Myxococcales bacterium]|nr:porphobilinogen synthase [Myxococcales bacterium]
MRRTRQAPWLRDMVREHALTTADLIWPIFVHEGEGVETPVASLPGVSRLTVDLAAKAAAEARALGIRAVAVFPVVPAEKKSADGAEAVNEANLACRAVRAIKAATTDLGVICDVALDPYTTHGHDGILKDGVILNDATVDVLVEQAIVQAKAGCDVIAPSDMMDGRIGRIRDGLDAAGFAHVSVLAYAAKYASAFYGPFRDAVGSAGNLGKGNKYTYQM